MGLGDILDPGDLLGFQQDDRVAKANAAAKQAYDKSMETSDANRALYNQYYNKMNQTYGDTAGKYGDYLSDLENLDVYDPGQAANQRINNAMNAITNSRANAGNMFTSDYANEMAAKQQALASEEWDKAYDRYNQDRAMALNEFSTNANLGNQRYQNQFNKSNTLLGQASNAQDNLSNAYGNYMTNLASQNNTDAQNYANYVQAQAANNLSKKGLIGRILG